MSRLLLIIALLAAPLTSMAGVIGRAESGAGGEIILTDVKGRCNSGHVVFSRAPNGEYITGCWELISKQYLAITWQDGDVRMYKTADFEYIGEETDDGL